MFVGEIMAQTNKPPTRGSDLMEPPPISAPVIMDSSATTKWIMIMWMHNKIIPKQFIIEG
jgi:hypothetical protein